MHTSNLIKNFFVACSQLYLNLVTHISPAAMSSGIIQPAVGENIVPTGGGGDWSHRSIAGANLTLAKSDVGHLIVLLAVFGMSSIAISKRRNGGREAEGSAKT